MRLAIVATPALLEDQRPAPGALDGDLVRARLPLADTAFHVIDVDPTVDVAEQLERAFGEGRIGRDDALVFYASCSVIVSVENELFLCLDPQDPTTGDSLRDVTAVFAERSEGPKLFVLECRHAPAAQDPFRSVAIVGAAKEAVESRVSGVELLVAARPLVPGQEDEASPFTRAVIGALDDADPGLGLTVEALYEQIRESDALLGVVPCFGHARGRASFELVPRTKRRAPAREAPATEPSAAESSNGEPAPPSGVEAAPATPHAASEPPEPSSRRASMPPTALPRARSFQRSDPPPLPKVIVSDRPPPPSHPPPSHPPPSHPPPSHPPPSHPPPSHPPSLRSQPPGPTSRPPASGSVPPLARSPSEHLTAGDAAIARDDPEGALDEYRKALGLLGTAASSHRARLYARIGDVKRRQARPREAISNFEKALQLEPADRDALEALMQLNVDERDWRAVLGNEEAVLATLSDSDRFARLVEFGDRWQDVAKDPTRAQHAFERARDLRPDDVPLLEKLRRLYESSNYVDEAIATRRHIAQLTTDPRARAEQYFALGQYGLFDLRREELGIEFLDLALDADPSMLEPLAVLARILAERQEWGELESAYRRMLERVERISDRAVRTGVAWELCRRLGLLYRDHLDDPELALDAFEDALELKPDDGAIRRTAIELARDTKRLDRAIAHLQAFAALEPTNVETYHELFEAFQRSRRPDQAYAAAGVTMHLRSADARERFVFEEHRPEGVPNFARPLRSAGWALLAARDRDARVESLIETIMPAAISAKLALLASDGRLPVLDPAARQDPASTTVSITRSFGWASHFLGIPAPGIYLVDDPSIGLVAVPAEQPAVIAGGKVLRGRSPTELAFLAGRQLAYYVAGHKLLLYYPSLDELLACLFAALALVVPGIPVPAKVADAARVLGTAFEERLDDDHRGALARAAKAFEKRPADVSGWAQAVERCAARAGYVLCGDLDVAAACIRAEAQGLLDADAKVGDLLAFTVSEAHHKVRQLLGIAIEP